MANTISATKLRKGNLIKHENQLLRIIEATHVTPGNLRGFVRVKMRNIRNGSLIDHRFRSEDVVERAILDFMDTSTYEQIHLSDEALGDSMLYLLPESTINVEFYESDPVGIELPQTVDLKVVEAVPAIKGATASAQLKPATLETGLVVNVPAFVEVGEKIRVNTETGEYLSRV